MREIKLLVSIPCHFLFDECITKSTHLSAMFHGLQPYRRETRTCSVVAVLMAPPRVERLPSAFARRQLDPRNTSERVIFVPPSSPIS